MLTYQLSGRVDSANASDFERDVFRKLDEAGATRLRLDASDLTYISSAGLRVVMRLLKRCDKVVLTGASRAVYDVFDMTGLTEMMEVRRAPRELDLRGKRQIGAGAFGRVFRLDAERVAKVYDFAPQTLERIERERRVARQAFIAGVPSALPFETVSTNEGFGLVYELVDARTLGEVAAAEPAQVEAWGERMARLARQLHETHLGAGSLPDARLILHGWADVAAASGLYAESTIARLRDTIQTMPPSDTFVHGDFHPANVMVMPDGELILIDMGDASMGSPLVDLAGTYHVLRVAAARPGGAERLTGMPKELLDRLWRAFVQTYFDVEGSERIAEVERRLRASAMPRIMGSTARSRLIDDETRARQARELEQEFLAGLQG